MRTSETDAGIVLGEGRDVTGQVDDAMRVSVVHCVYREGMAAVFGSQVLRPMEGYVEAGLDTELVIFAPIGERIRRGPRARWLEIESSIRRVIGDRYSILHSPPARARWAWSDESAFKRWLRRRVADNENLILHCRGAGMAEIAMVARGICPSIRVVFDCRGVDHAEKLYVNGYREPDEAPEELRAAWRDDYERCGRMVREADGVICVSDAMKRYLMDEFGVDAGKMVVSPCCVNVERFLEAGERRKEIREKFGLCNRVVVGYCGSIREWQCAEQSVSLFGEVAKRVENAHLLAVTTQPDAMKRVVASEGIDEDRVTICSVGHDEVASYLSAFDVGLLLRHDCLVNRVASPVKFGEYLAAGVPVVLTEGVGDYSRIVKDEEVGMVVEMGSNDVLREGSVEKVVGYLQGLSDDARARCREVARERLEISSHVKRIMGLYDKLLLGEDL